MCDVKTFYFWVVSLLYDIVINLLFFFGKCAHNIACPYGNVLTANATTDGTM